MRSLKDLDHFSGQAIAVFKEAIASTNKPKLTKRDIQRLRAIRERLSHMDRQFHELRAFVSTRLFHAIGGTNASSSETKPPRN